MDELLFAEKQSHGMAAVCGATSRGVIHGQIECGAAPFRSSGIGQLNAAFLVC